MRRHAAEEQRRPRWRAMPRHIHFAGAKKAAPSALRICRCSMTLRADAAAMGHGERATKAHLRPLDAAWAMDDMRERHDRSMPTSTSPPAALCARLGFDGRERAAMPKCRSAEGARAAARHVPDVDAVDRCARHA